MATFDVRFEVRTRAAQWWLTLVVLPTHWVFGERAARRVALFGLQRLVRYRVVVGGGLWQRFPRDTFAAIVDDRVSRG